MARPTGSRRRHKAKGEPGASERLARLLAQAALEKKAEQILILDLRTLTSMTDFFVIGTVSTVVHGKAVLEHVQQRAREELDERPWHVEGESGGSTWVLLDFVDVVLHLFHPEARAFYRLERLWGDAPTERVQDSP